MLTQVCSALNRAACWQCNPLYDAVGSAGSPPATLQASLSFLRSAKVGETLHVIASVSKVGRRPSFGSAQVCNQKGKLVAEFQAAGVQP